MKLKPLSADVLIGVSKLKYSMIISKSPPNSNLEFNSDMSDPDVILAS